VAGRRDDGSRFRQAPRRRVQLRRQARLRGPGAALRPGRPRVRAYQAGAQQRLRRFRQGSMLAVALTALVLLIWGLPEDLVGQQVPEPAAPVEVPADPAEGLEQATVTLRDLLLGFYARLPQILLALGLVALAAVASRVAGALLRRLLGRWEKAEAASALVGIGLYLGAIATALSILAGDARALLGSVGLIGLALSWALQTPIESFTGWLLNSFRTYYRVGDRIEVGEVFGDVYKIDVLTTTVWEAGGPGKSVAGAQSTGAMITFPNWEVLRSNIVNYSRDFPYVWDEVTIPVANESDLAYTIGVFERLARGVVGDAMAGAAQQYRDLLARARLAFDAEAEPRVFLSLADAWTNCTVRYLVPARARRRRASELILALTTESEKPEHRGRIVPAYPRTEVRLREGWQQPGDRGEPAD
jgi:small conductance mechanosensitive channel